MSVGRPNIKPLFDSEAYEANRARIEQAKAVIRAAELENEEGRKNHARMEEELRTKIREGEEARRVLEQLEASRRNGLSRDSSAYLPSPAITAPPAQGASEVAGTSRIEEVPSYTPTYSTGPQIQPYWPSTAQNVNYTANNTASYSAPTTQAYSNVANRTLPGDYSSGHAYTVPSNNLQNEASISHIAQSRSNYGPIHQSYPTFQTSSQDSSHIQRRNTPQNLQPPQSTHHIPVAPSANQQAGQNTRQYSGGTREYSTQQPLQHFNAYQSTAAVPSSVETAATSIGKKKAYQPPAAASSSLDGALTPVVKTNFPVASKGSTNRQSPSRQSGNDLRTETNAPDSLSKSKLVSNSSHSSRTLSTMQEKARQYLIKFANQWSPTAPPNSFVHIPNLRPFSLYKGYDCKLRIAMNTDGSVKIVSLDKFISEELPSVMTAYVEQLASNQQATSSSASSTLPEAPSNQSSQASALPSSTTTPSSHTMQTKSVPIPSTAVRSSNNVSSATHTIIPIVASTSSATLSATSLPVNTMAPTSPTPNSSQTNATPSIPRTPAQVDKTHLARDLLRALKRPRPSASGSLESEAKRHATESRVLTGQMNGSIQMKATRFVEPSASAANYSNNLDTTRLMATGTTSSQPSASVPKQHATDNVLTGQRNDSVQKKATNLVEASTPAVDTTTTMPVGATPSQGSASASLESEPKQHATESGILTGQGNEEINNETASIVEASAPAATNSNLDNTRSVSTGTTPSLPPVSNTSINTTPSPGLRENNDVEDDAGTVINPPQVQRPMSRTDTTAPPAVSIHDDIIVIDDRSSNSSESEGNTDDEDDSRTAIKSPRAQRSMSPEIPLPSPIIRTNVASIPSPSEIEPLTLTQSGNGRSVVTGKLSTRKGTQNLKARAKIPYVLVPPPPEYVLQYKRWQERNKPGSVSRGQRADDYQIALDFQVEALPPFASDENERRAVEVSCGRLCESPCKWTGCETVLNSAQSLIAHLRTEHIPPNVVFTCFWKSCGHRGVEDGLSLGHVERHALASLHCAYEDCDESFRQPRQLVRHNALLHKDSTLKPTADLKPINAATSLPPCPGVIPVTMIETATINRALLPDSRHATLAAKVLKDISGPVHLRTERNSPRKHLRPSEYGRNEEEDGSDRYACLASGASSKHYSAVLSSPAKIRGPIADVDSVHVTELIANGLVLWGPPEAEQTELPLDMPPSASVSGFYRYGSDDGDEEVRPEEFDELELRRRNPLPDRISTSRPDAGNSEEEVVESMLAME